MKVINVLSSLINSEIENTDFSLVKVDAPTIQGVEWQWFLLYFDGSCTSHVTVKDLLFSFSPLSCGELVGCCNQDQEGYIANIDSIPTKIDGKSIYELMESEYLKNAFEKRNQKTILLLRTKKNDLISADRLVVELRNKTWFQSRSLPHYLINREVDITIGASHEVLKGQTQDPISCFETSIGLFFVSEYNVDESKIKIFQYSKLFVQERGCSVNDFLTAIRFPEDQGYGFDLRIPIVVNIFLKTDYPIDNGRILEEISLQSDTCQRIRKLVVERLNIKKNRIAMHIERRREQLNHRKKVYISSENVECNLGFAPTNETELIILAAKLEPYLKKYFSEFQILEHTSQSGIDGLIKIRRTPAHTTEVNSCVEYEYELSNFFKHEHPIQQTIYIICWKIGDINEGEFCFDKRGIRKDGRIEAKLLRDDWIWVLSCMNHLIYILPLQSFPSLKIR